MKVVTLKTFLNVNQLVQPGREIEVEDGRGAQLIKLGLARAVGAVTPPPSDPPAASEPETPAGQAKRGRK